MTVEGITNALYLLWWVQHKDVSPAAVAVVLAAGDLAITTLEVPTGWLADLVGHRRSLIAGSVIQKFAMLLCWLGEGIGGLLAASVCVALGDTFRSGADQALLYRSCVSCGCANRFQRIEATASSVELTGLVAMMIAGGILVETVGFPAAWIAETALAAVGVLLAMAMVDPPARVTADDPSTLDERRPLTSLAAVVRLLPLIAPAALLAGMANAAAFVAQTAGGADAVHLTVLVSALTLSEAAGASLSRYLHPDRRTQYALLGAGVLLLAASFANASAFLPAVVGLSVLMGMAEPLRATAIQMAVERRRAEAASWAGAIAGAVRTLLLLFAGFRIG